MVDGDHVLPEEAEWRQLMSHPRFPQAARALARNMLLACEEDASLCVVFKDAGAYLTAMSAMYLNSAGESLTLARLKEVCTASGFLSAGRARSLLQILNHLRYVEPTGSSRVTTYAPTPAFVDAWRRHLHLALLAAAVIEPSLTLLCDRLENPGVFEALLTAQMTRLRPLMRGGDSFAVLTRAFLHPHAGHQILWMLILAGDERFPPEGRLSISLAQLAARFQVSRVHIRRVLAAAEREGLIEYHTRGAVAFTDAGRRIVGLQYAFQIVELIGAGQEASRLFATRP